MKNWKLIQYSVKRLARTPGKTSLAFLLMLFCVFLLVFSVRMAHGAIYRINEVRDSFSTLGAIEQLPVEIRSETKRGLCYSGGRYERKYGDLITLEEMDFPGAEYSQKPEYRPYFAFESKALRHVRSDLGIQDEQVLQFTVTEPSDSAGSCHVLVERNLTAEETGPEGSANYVRPGSTIRICQCFSKAILPLEQGNTYIANLIYYSSCSLHDVSILDREGEYVAYIPPYTNQYDKSGNELSDDGSFLKDYRVETVEDDFWESGQGEKWKSWVSLRREVEQSFLAEPVNDLDMIPVFQSKGVSLKSGREITPEEFAAGAPVCMIPYDFAQLNSLSAGDSISMSMRYSIYGMEKSAAQYFPSFSPYNVSGELFSPFWDAEYTVVGIYDPVDSNSVYTSGAMPRDLFLIPAKSVKNSDENNIVIFNPMTPGQATFQIPNGTIEEFDSAFRENVKTADQLQIIYNDNGYSKIIKDLQSSRLTSIILLVFGALSTIAVLILILYFFVVKEKQRTAIERSLGQTERQCRVSLLSGILALIIAASLLGGIGAELLYPAIQSETGAISQQEEVFSTKFSAAQNNVTAVEPTSGEVPVPFYLPLIPLGADLLAAILSLLIVNRSLRIEPICLLSWETE